MKRPLKNDDIAKLAKSNTLNTKPLLGLINDQTLITLMPSTLLECDIRFLYPLNNSPLGKFGAQVITVTSYPFFTHSFVCSYVLLAGALTSGGKLSVRNKIFFTRVTYLNLNFFLNVVN